MTLRQILFLLLLLALSKVLAYFFGPQAEIWVILGIVAVGVYATLRHEGMLHSLAVLLSRQPNPGQTLVNLGDSTLRPLLSKRLDLPPPSVPLRGVAEYFRYPSSGTNALRAIAAVSLGVYAFLVYAIATDPRQRAGAWYDLLAGLVLFPAAAAYLAYWGWFAPTTVEITDTHIATLGWRGVHRRIPWEQVMEFAYSTSGLRVRSPSGTIRVSYIITDYGRLLNLIAARVPAR